MKRILIVAIVVLSVCGYAAVCGARTFDTPYFRINLPDHFTTVIPPADLIGGGSERFAYLFVEKNKERSKSILIVVMGGKVSDDEMADKERALTVATNAFRKSLTKSSKCEGELSGTVRTRIGDSDALYFEKTNRDCKVVIERYWTAIGSEYFITFSIYRITDADNRTYEQCIEAVNKSVLK